MTRVAILGALLAAACNTVSVGNNNPTGTVGGVLIDAATEMPLAGANATLISGAQTLTATTDGNGIFQFTNVPAGSFIVEFAAMGYQGFDLRQMLGGNVGNFPVNNPVLTLGPLGLIPNDGTFAVHLVTDNGGPAAMVTATLRTNVRYVDFTTGSPQPTGTYTVSATSDANGFASFTGVPNFTKLGNRLADNNIFQGPSQVDVAVAPTLVAGSQDYNFLGVIITYDLLRLNSTACVATTATGGCITGDTPTITLAGPRTPLSVLGSNVEYIVTQTVTGSGASVIPPSNPITIAFNQAVDANSITVMFTDDSNIVAPLQATATVNINVVSIAVMGFSPGARYTMAFHASAAQNGDANRDFTTIAPLFIAQASPLAVSTIARNGSSGLVVTFSEAIGPGHGGYVYNPAPCIAYYDGSNLDNSDPGTYPGEWPTNGAAGTSCATFNVNLPVGFAAPLSDITALGPLENQAIPGSMKTPSLYTPISTGYSRIWYINFGAGGCSPSAPPGCTTSYGNASQIVHFVFSHQPGFSSTLGTNATFHTVTGDSVPDTLSGTIM